MSQTRLVKSGKFSARQITKKQHDALMRDAIGHVFHKMNVDDGMSTCGWCKK